MTKLAAFQQATVDAALACLGGNGPRRFLVADEVGLGKTVIARAIAQGLRMQRRTLNLLYLCPSLEIVGQNRSKFISLTGVPEERYVAGEDRLALVPGSPPQDAAGFRIFTFTPETSLPGWKPGPRTGRKAERALIREVLERFPRLLARVREIDRQRSRASGTCLLLGEASGSLGGYTWTSLVQALRDVFSCPDGPLERSIGMWLSGHKDDLPELIARFRSALALAALRSRNVRPDLVVLDEFHRYADLILPSSVRRTGALDAERASVHRMLVDALLGGEPRPAVLLLSATPYRLRRLSGEEIHGVDHYHALIDLAGFLADDEGYRDRVERAMRDYHDALSTPGDPAAVQRSVLAAKRGLEGLLTPLMERTERALVHREDLFERRDEPVSVETEDLRIYRHLARAAAEGKSGMAGWAPAMWTSIPYPAQTMHGYKIWSDLLAAGRPTLEAGAARTRLAHPQLRAMLELAADSTALSLPWQPSTMPWWRLEGPWAAGRTNQGKSLLFSRWRAAPTAVSALLSLQLSRGLRKPGTKAPVPLLRPGGSESGALIGLFAQWPVLSSAIDPCLGGGGITAIRRRARAQLLDFLRDSERVRLDGKERRRTWLVARGLERTLSRHAYQGLAHVILKRARVGAKGADWRNADPIDRVSPAEVAALADHLLSAPGAIVARCVRRHGLDLGDRKQREAVFDFAWGRLRGYLGHRLFADLILTSSRRQRYPDALCDAMLKGGFEAVLDEQMTILRRLGDASGLQLVEQLSACLMDRPGLVRLRRSGRDHRVPVHAVAPFSGGEQRGSGKRKGGALRSDGLRRAFNSPFWPHVLCTTSVGQEGLDFHLWCRRVVHWDLPSDPVDFEQREGRIARYGSLAVRRSLASAHAGEALARSDPPSPFDRLLQVASEQPSGRTGLERWWLVEHGRPESVSFAWRFSQRSHRKERMLENLLYYRLALGQPDSKAFMAMLQRLGATGIEARRLALDLSAISRKPDPEVSESTAGEAA